MQNVILRLQPRSSSYNFSHLTGGMGADSGRLMRRSAGSRLFMLCVTEKNEAQIKWVCLCRVDPRVSLREAPTWKHREPQHQQKKGKKQQKTDVRTENLKIGKRKKKTGLVELMCLETCPPTLTACDSSSLRAESSSLSSCFWLILCSQSFAESLAVLMKFTKTIIKPGNLYLPNQRRPSWSAVYLCFGSLHVSSQYKPPLDSDIGLGKFN